MSHKDPQKKDVEPSINYEVLAAIALALMALAAYATQILLLNEKTTRLEGALFNALQFLLTVGFTWFSSRALTKREFEASLKKFAVSAYRRISDIDRIVARLKRTLDQMTGEEPS